MEKGYLHPDFFQANAAGAGDIAGELYGSNSLQDALVNHFEYKLEHLLKWEDRNSMWFSIEARVPFLDYRLVERTLLLPDNLIIQKGMTKHVLREAMKGTLPEQIRMRRDKVGFETPEAEWFRTPLFQKIYHGSLFLFRLRITRIDRTGKGSGNVSAPPFQKRELFQGNMEVDPSGKMV
ncbi:MAG: hypothetical protein IPJ40_22215 [Saprospirales bacterium]|nr:hypothetical protein [Saprospirales bacterium]